MKPTIAIIGLGLIGGSLAQALRGSGHYRVLGIARRAATLREARRRGALDAGSTRLADAAAARRIVICTPVDAIVPTARKLLPYLAPGTILMDAGSVKGAILKEMAKLLRGSSVFFVGAHPLAGSHHTGIGSARPDLFKGSMCVLVPLGRSPVAPAAALWRSAGARTRVMTARAHDAAIARTSHLPHVIAHALVRLIIGRPPREAVRTLLAGSFRDMTRVASADPGQWTEILRANQSDVRRALRDFRQELDRLERSLKTSRLKPLLARSRAFRAPLFHGV